MIIACPCGKKKFEVNASLIPSEGKMLQCGACSEKWFFKKEIKKEVIKEEKKPLVKIPKNIEKVIPDVTEDLISEAETTIPKIKKKDKINKKINTLSILVVVIISFVALVILADTFKNSLNLIIPGFDLILNSLYETIKDIVLFIEDLFK
tara:strand:- start:783 stop:1232 length:450 start_codon:yes stop_codon:yes gene_type:complete